MFPVEIDPSKTDAPSVRSSSAHAASGQPAEFLSFRLGSEEYGIDILNVQEIRGYEEPTRMVNAPSYVKGVVNLRGVIVPIVDLRIKFGLPEPRYDSVTVTIVLNIGSRVIGMVVDSVSDVIRLEGGDIRPAPQFGEGASTGHIIGLATVKEEQRERMLILMDIAQLMGSADMKLIAQAERP